jgi:hypothetical protein
MTSHPSAVTTTSSSIRAAPTRWLIGYEDDDG